MTTRLMRAVDRFAGIPLCLWTGLLLRLSRRRIPPAQNFRNILVIKFFGLGSVLLSTPFLASLRERFPSARITYLSFASNEELVKRIPEVNESLSISTSSPRLFLATAFTALRKIRRSGIDVVFDLEFFSKFSTLISTLSGAPNRVGFFLPTRWRRWNLTSSVPLDHDAHATAVFLGQLRGVDARTGAHPPVLSLSPTPGELESMREKLQMPARAVSNICVNINAGQTSLERRWSPDRFAEVGRRLIKRGDSLRLFFTGNAAEREYVEQLLRRHPDLRSRSWNCAGILSLGEVIALLNQSLLLISNDSAPVHIASAVGTPTIALFGPESPRFYGSLQGGKTIYKALACSPCLNVYAAKLFACPFNARCMSEISVEEVMEAVDELLPLDEYSSVPMNESAQ